MNVSFRYEGEMSFAKHLSHIQTVGDRARLCPSFDIAVNRYISTALLSILIHWYLLEVRAEHEKVELNEH